MEETLNDHGLLDVIAIISANRESGRLKIQVGATVGFLFFKEGKLVDAHMGTLRGFPAINAAVSIREAHFSFDPSVPPPTSSFNTATERIVLKRLFGIETVETEAGNDQMNASPSELPSTRSREVPLSEAVNPAWYATDPKYDAHKQEQQERRIKAEPEVARIIESQPKADGTRGLIEEEDRRKLEETEGRSVAEQENFVETLSLPVTRGFAANETLQDSQQKLCPTCNRSYSDDSLNYCLNDGTPLSAPDPEVTLVTDNGQSSNLRKITSYSFLPSLPSPGRIGLYVAVLLVLMGAGAGALLFKLNDRHSQISAAKPSESSLPRVTEAGKQIEQESSGVQNLTGRWKVVNIIEKTSYRSFANLKIAFRLRINQTGPNFTAEGEKLSENGRILSATGRTPIRVTGHIDGERVEATFIEEGMRRKTSGRFVWRIEKAGAGLTGTFVSTAARTSGKSAATKEL